jgi:hypothetical protein
MTVEIQCKVKVRVKCTLMQTLRLCTGHTAHRGSRGIALPFLDHGTRRGWGVSVTSRPLFTPGKDPVPLYRGLGGPQGRSGQVQKISPPLGFNRRTVQPIASRYTDYATRPTEIQCGRIYIQLVTKCYWQLRLPFSGTYNTVWIFV